MIAHFTTEKFGSLMIPVPSNLRVAGRILHLADCRCGYGQSRCARSSGRVIRCLMYRNRGYMDNRAVPKMTPECAALVGLMNCYLRGLLDPFVTLLEVHKLMYFMQATGEPLKLQFAKDTYGPYAENLRQVLNDIEGHLVSGYADGGDAPDKELELVPGALEDAHAFLENEPETHARFERVSALIEGFESSFGLELLSTVHWIASEEKILDFDDIVNHTYA